MYWYDKDSKVIADSSEPEDVHQKNIMAVDKLLGNLKYKRVGFNRTFFRRYEVSTVWMGLDHDFNKAIDDKPNPKPVIFESMVFDRRTRDQVESKDIESFGRYSNKEDALAGHKRLFKEWNTYERKHVWRTFWSLKTSWSRVPGMIFWAGEVILLSGLFPPLLFSHSIYDHIFNIVGYFLFIPYWIQMFVRMHQQSKAWKWKKLEFFIDYTIMAREAKGRGDKEFAEQIEKIRDNITKW
jgi:hypothetical protein